MIKRLLFLILLAFSGLSAQQTEQLPYPLSTKSNVWGTTTKLSDGTEQYSSTTGQKIASGTRSVLTSILIGAAVATIVNKKVGTSDYAFLTKMGLTFFAGWVVGCAGNYALAKALNDKNNKAQVVPTIIGAFPLGLIYFI